MDVLSDFGKRLRELRTRMAMSQSTLAERSGLDRSYVGQVERGERNISLKNIEVLCNALDVDLSYFFDNERFSLQMKKWQKEFSKSLEERFVYTVDPVEGVIAWQIKGALQEQEVTLISHDLKSAYESLLPNIHKVKLLIDNRHMVDTQPFVFIPEVMEKWEVLQRWFEPRCEKAAVLCNSKLMKNQMLRLAKRSGIHKKQMNLYDPDDKQLVRKAYQFLGIQGNPLVREN